MIGAKFIVSIDLDLTIRCILLGGMFACEIFIFAALISVNRKIRREEKQE